MSGPTIRDPQRRKSLSFDRQHDLVVVSINTDEEEKLGETGTAVVLSIDDVEFLVGHLQDMVEAWRGEDL